MEAGLAVSAGGGRLNILSMHERFGGRSSLGAGFTGSLGLRPAPVGFSQSPSFEAERDRFRPVGRWL